MIARLRSEQGFTLVEALVSVAILTMALVVFLAGLSTGVLSTSHSDRLSTAHELARSQMEYTKAQAFDPVPSSYATVTPPSSYGVTVAASAIPEGDPAIQLITVDVSKDGSVVFSLQGYKAGR
jgi:type II secretory pathway pseudopilin PulG